MTQKKQQKKPQKKTTQEAVLETGAVVQCTPLPLVEVAWVVEEGTAQKCVPFDSSYSFPFSLPLLLSSFTLPLLPPPSPFFLSDSTGNQLNSSNKQGRPFLPRGKSRALIKAMNNCESLFQFSVSSLLFAHPQCTAAMDGLATPAPVPFMGLHLKQ